MDDETWVRETLARSGHRLDEEALGWAVLVSGAMRRSLEPLLDADLTAVAPEVDLDPSRPPHAR